MVDLTALDALFTRETCDALRAVAADDGRNPHTRRAATELVESIARLQTRFVLDSGAPTHVRLLNAKETDSGTDMEHDRVHVMGAAPPTAKEGA